MFKLQRRLAPIVFATCVLSAAHARAAEPPWELWQIGADGKGLTVFAETPGYTCGSPDWSPDGKLVAFDTWRLSEKLQDSQIAVIRADGTDRRLIGAGAMPSWSPDGKQLVFHTYAGAYDTDKIVVMNADGTGREVIANHWGSPRWSPKGNRIASILNSNIALYDIATGTERTILPERYSVHWGFAVSPDGLQFCFGESDGGVNLATLDERTMTTTVRPIVKEGMCRHASFSPDGKRVVFSWQPSDSERGQLYIADVDAKDPPKPLEGQDTKRNNYNPDWSPDGKTIIFVSQHPATSP